MLIQHSECWRRPLAVMVAKFMLNVRPDDSVLPQLMYKSLVHICSYRPQRSGRTRLRRALCVSINKLATCISHFTTLQPLVKYLIHPFSVTSHRSQSQLSLGKGRIKSPTSSSVHNNQQPSALTFTVCKISLTCMTVDCGKKSECLLRTQAGTGRRSRVCTEDGRWCLIHTTINPGWTHLLWKS